jgi:hypothetical protein
MTQKRKNNHKQKGGRTGTSGSFSTLEGNIEALVKSTVDTIINTVELIADVVEIPSDVGKAYTEPKAQNLSV